MFVRKGYLVASLLVAASLVFAGCTSSSQAQINELQNALATAQASEGSEAQIAELQQQLNAAQAAASAPQYESYSAAFKNPDTLTNLWIGEPESLDTAIMYDSPGINVARHLYDGLLFLKGSAVDEFVPMLADEWSISDDGLTYTFHIREGVRFHKGGTLEPHDVAYTFHRNMLLGWDFLGAGGPMGLFFDPMLETAGIGAAGDGGLLDVVGGDDLKVCEAIRKTVVADDTAGTVTIKLAYPAAYFAQLLVQPWSGIMDKEWMIEQGAWDDDCATWRNWYLPEVSATLLYSAENGTGPYMLDHWTAGQELVLTANPDWWVKAPLWEGSTIDGVPEIGTIVIKVVEEWGTRLAMVEAGDADTLDHEIAFASQIDPMIKTKYTWQEGKWVEEEVNPEGILSLYTKMPAASTDDIFLNFNIPTEGGNPYIGSGQLDGTGIPPDFFSDIHVRKAFNYCFDRDTFIAEVRQGEAFPHRGPIIEGMPGYEADSFIYNYDLEKCAEELKLAWNGAVWENGFTMSFLYNTGNDSRRIASEILADGLTAVNDKISIGITNLPWATYMAARRAGRLPLHQTGWIEDFHHPHNWVIPYMSCSGDWSRAQHFPEAMCGPWDTTMAEAVRETDPAKAVALYKGLQGEAMDQAIDIFIAQITLRRYVQSWVQGYYYNPLFGDDPYMAGLSKVPPQ
jgi:peptide/nickel transport system substrate-binding protein